MSRLSSAPANATEFQAGAYSLFIVRFVFAGVFKRGSEPLWNKTPLIYVLVDPTESIVKAT